MAFFAILLVRVFFVSFSAFQAQDLIRRGIEGIFRRETKTHWIVGRIKFSNKRPLYPLFPSGLYARDYKESWKEQLVRGDQAWRLGVLYFLLGLMFCLFTIILAFATVTGHSVF